jgi:hypothetical protein
MKVFDLIDWNELLEDLRQAGKTMGDSDERAYAAYQAVQVLSEGDPGMSLGPYAGPIPDVFKTPAVSGGYSPTAYDPWRPRTTPKAPPKTGYSCTGCNNFNPDAAANQPNGTYVCYNCRA